MDKKQLQKEKDIVSAMQANLQALSPIDKQELLRLKCRTDFLTFAKFMTIINHAKNPLTLASIAL